MLDHPTVREKQKAAKFKATRFAVVKVGELWWAIDFQQQRVWRRWSWKQAFDCLLFEYGPEGR